MVAVKLPALQLAHTVLVEPVQVPLLRYWPARHVLHAVQTRLLPVMLPYWLAGQAATHEVLLRKVGLAQLRQLVDVGPLHVAQLAWQASHVLNVVFL